MPGHMPVVQLHDLGCTPVEPRWHRYRLHERWWRIYLVDRPGLTLTWSGGTLSYPVDGLTIIPGWLPYTFFMKPDVIHAWIHFEVPTIPKPMTTSLFPGPWIWRDAWMQEQMWKLGQLMASPHGNTQLIAIKAHALAQLTLVHALDRLDVSERKRALSEARSRLEPVLAHIEANLHRPLAVRDLAKEVGLEPESLIRAFKRTFGQTLMQYILERRCGRAATALATSEQPIEEIAISCGFPNRQYMARMFGKRIGMPPAAYRRLHRKDRSQEDE